jgi:nucleotide-binding universal stress UspA family protein
MSPQVRPGARAPNRSPAGSDGRGAPVVLATLAVPFDPESARVALQAAMETNVKLIVVDAVERPWWPQALATRYAELELAEDRAEIRRFAGHAAALGLDVEHLRVPSPRPVEALLEVAAERAAGLLVLGPDRSRFKPRRFARLARRVRRRASCLLWVAGEGP